MGYEPPLNRTAEIDELCLVRLDVVNRPSPSAGVLHLPLRVRVHPSLRGRQRPHRAPMAHAAAVSLEILIGLATD